MEDSAKEELGEADLATPPLFTTLDVLVLGNSFMLPLHPELPFVTKIADRPIFKVSQVRSQNGKAWQLRVVHVRCGDHVTTWSMPFIVNGGGSPADNPIIGEPAYNKMTERRATPVGSIQVPSVMGPLSKLGQWDDHRRRHENYDDRANMLGQGLARAVDYVWAQAKRMKRQKQTLEAAHVDTLFDDIEELADVKPSLDKNMVAQELAAMVAAIEEDPKDVRPFPELAAEWAREASRSASSAKEQRHDSTRDGPQQVSSRTEKRSRHCK